MTSFDGLAYNRLTVREGHSLAGVLLAAFSVVDWRVSVIFLNDSGRRTEDGRPATVAIAEACRTAFLVMALLHVLQMRERECLLPIIHILKRLAHGDAATLTGWAVQEAQQHAFLGLFAGCLALQCFDLYSDESEAWFSLATRRTARITDFRTFLFARLLGALRVHTGNSANIALTLLHDGYGLNADYATALLHVLAAPNNGVDVVRRALRTISQKQKALLRVAANLPMWVARLTAVLVRFRVEEEEEEEEEEEVVDDDPTCLEECLHVRQQGPLGLHGVCLQARAGG